MSQQTYLGLNIWLRGAVKTKPSMLKTVVMTVDYRSGPSPLSRLTLLNSIVSAVETFRFL